MIKRILSILVVSALMLALVPAVALAAEGDTTPGQFELGNSCPENVSVTLKDTGGSAVSSMTPQVEYYAAVYVEDANTLDDLSTVTVVIFYDADGTYSAGEEVGAADTQTRAILTWTNSGGGGTFSIDPTGGGTTWELVTANCVEPTLTDGSGTFEFHFKPGKVATETTGTDKWHIWAEADDGDTGCSSNTATDENKNMDWYGEIDVITSSVDWGTVTPGTGFANDVNEQGSIEVKYISNGAYDEEIAASTPWTDGGSNSAALDEDGTPAANEFSMKANDADDIGTSVLVKALGTGYTAIDDTGTQTAEAGDDETDNTLWLKLGTPFTDATYSGTIYFKITDGS